jgi:hypothetical protein
VGVRRLILDDGLPRALAAELRARGRGADHVAELGLECATDAEVLALDGVLVTTVRVHAPGATVAVVRGGRREAVHRHAHEMAAQRPGSIRRYLGS